MGKSCSFSVLCVSFVNVYEFCACASFRFEFEGGIWDLIVFFLIIAFFTYFMISVCRDSKGSICPLGYRNMLNARRIRQR